MANTTGTASGVGSASGGQQGWDAAVNVQTIPPSNAGTLAAGTAGNNFAGTLNADFSKIVTNLVIRNIIENLRTAPAILQEMTFVRARHVPGTNSLVYTFFADLSPAVDVLEGVPPESERLNFDTMSMVGKQKAKLVAVTDLAGLMSPFDIWSIAAEKVAWNAIDTAEKDAATVLASGGLTFTPAGTTSAARITEAVTAMKVAEIPTFPDGTYHALVNPADAATIMNEAGALGWTEVQKYARPEAILNNEIGKFRGVRFIETNRIAAANSVLFGPEFIAWGDYQSIQAYRVAPGGDHADPLAQRGLVGWKGMWGMKAISFAGTGLLVAGPAANPQGWRYVRADLTP